MRRFYRFLFILAIFIFVSLMFFKVMVSNANAACCSGCQCGCDQFQICNGNTCYTACACVPLAPPPNYGAPCGRSGSSCEQYSGGVWITMYKQGTINCGGGCSGSSSSRWDGANHCNGNTAVTYSCNKDNDGYVEHTHDCGSTAFCSLGECIPYCGSFGTQMTSAQSRCRSLSGQSSWFSGDCSTGHNDANSLPVNERESAYYYGSGTNINLHCVDDGYCKPATLFGCWLCSCFTCTGNGELNYDKTNVPIADCTDNGKYDSQCVYVKQCGSSPVEGTTIQTSGNLIGCDFKPMGTDCTTSSGAAGACNGEGKCISKCSDRDGSCTSDADCCGSGSLQCVNSNGPIDATNTGNGYCCPPATVSGDVAVWDPTLAGSDKCSVKQNFCQSCTVDWCTKNILLCSQCNSSWVGVIQ